MVVVVLEDGTHGEKSMRPFLYAHLGLVLAFQAAGLSTSRSTGGSPRVKC